MNKYRVVVWGWFEGDDYDTGKPCDSEAAYPIAATDEEDAEWQASEMLDDRWGRHDVHEFRVEEQA